MGCRILVLILLIFLPAICSQTVEDAVLVVNTTAAIAETDVNYICATIDWWPQDKCNYNQCPWGSSSVINLDLSHPLLAKAVQAFKNLRLRIGGSLQDQVHYNIGNLKHPCHPFRKEKGGLFGFSTGCLHMKRWDELNGFFKRTGVLVTFGLNALYGRYQVKKGVWAGNWDSSNARDFIKYTISKAYQIYSWEFGNELSGKGIGASVGAEQYGKDVIRLKSIIEELYMGFHPRPLIMAPGGFYDKEWFNKLLQVSGPNVVNVLTHHLYNLGAGVDRHLVDKIMNPYYLSKVSGTFNNLSVTIQTNGPWASAWVGESGGAYNSGGRNVSDTYVNSFWYLDQLGMAATYNTKVYCRQTLIGGNYALLDTNTFIPNPDYYSALLWHRLMGTRVLAVTSNASPYLRAYAHCAKERTGITLLLINLSNQTEFRIHVRAITDSTLHATKRKYKKGSFVHGLKNRVSWVGTQESDQTLFREEYHLTPEDGDLQSKSMLLNGMRLELTDSSDIPSLAPILHNLNASIFINPLSIKFVAIPNFYAPICT